MTGGWADFHGFRPFGVLRAGYSRFRGMWTFQASTSLRRMYSLRLMW